MLADLKKLVDGFVRDESQRLSRTDKEIAIQLAVLRYSTDRPRRKVEDVFSGGGDVLPLPSAWQDGSRILSVEYPIGADPACFIPAGIYVTPDGDQLKIADYLSPGVEARVTFTVTHVVSDVADTVLASHREAVAAYAAAVLLEQLSAAAINDGESTIAADSTDRRTKAQEYAARARGLKGRYGDILGVGAPGAGGQAATGVVSQWPSRPRLTGGIRRG